MNWLNEKLRQLIIRYSSYQHLLVKDDLVSLSRKTLRKQILIGRDLSQYFCFNLSAVPKAKRLQALQHQLVTHFYGEQPQYSVAWKQGVAQVWVWDNAFINQQLSNLGPELSGALHISEVVYWEPPAQDGIYLFSAQKGFDLQYWKAGILQASQWFEVYPFHENIRSFCRGQSVIIDPSELASSSPILRQEPWQGVQVSLVDNLLEHRSRWLTFLVAASVFLLTLQATSLIKVYWGIHSLEQQVADMETATTELLAARSQARNNALELQNLSQIMDVPDSLWVQQLVMTRLPSIENRKLVNWERNVNQISLTLKGRIADTLSVVKALEQQGITNVKVEPLPDGDRYKITMTLGSVGNS